MKKCCLERYTELESKIIDAFYIIILVSVCAEAVVCRKLESEVCSIERIVNEAQFGREIESPVVMTVHEGGHVGTLC